MMKINAKLLVVVAAFVGGGVFAGDFTSKVTWENLPQFCSSNVGWISGKPTGIWVEHHGLGCVWFRPNLTKERRNLAERGIVFIHPHYSPWGWMNDASVRLTDALVDVVKAHYALTDVPILSTGGSMGGLGALVWPCYSRHRVTAVAAICPVTDLVYHYTERPDLPRTLTSAYAYAPDIDKAIAEHSPFHLVGRLPRIPYFVVHSTADRAVNKGKHSDKFVEAMRKAGYNVTYVASEGKGHCQLTREAQKSFDDATAAVFQKK